MPIHDHRLSFPVRFGELPPLEVDEPELVEEQLARRRLLLLMKDLDGTPLSAERLGWLHFWTRAWNALDCRSEATNPLVLHAAQRAAQELHVQVQLVLRPVTSSLSLLQKFNSEATTPPEAWDSVLERLRGAAAWALWNDREKWLRTRSKLNQMYDPAPARELRRDPEALAVHEAFIGSVPTASDQELRAQKEAARGRIEAELRRINDWLGSPGFEKWASVTTQSSFEPPALGWFLGEEIKTYGDQLRVLDQSLLRVQHSISSSVLHGSSADELGQLIDRDYFPAVRAFPGEVEGVRQSVVGDVNTVWIALGSLRRRCWSGEILGG